MIMMNLSELFKYFRLLSEPATLSEKESAFLQKFLLEEYDLREKKKIEYLMKRSGIKRLKLLEDFDWKFNPRLPKDKFMQYINTTWLKQVSNLVIIGPAGVGKTHIATALCHQAIINAKQTIFISLYDLCAKLSKTKSIYTLIDYYAKVPVLCLDELGYVLPTKDQADAIFQIISKRSEINTTILTSNLIPSLWGKIFDSTTATAILDRLSMNGTFITFEGKSYRGKRKK